MTVSKKQNIAECKEIAQRHDAQAVVIMRIERDGTINLSTYGETAHKCEVIGEWAQRSIPGNYSRVPFETVFGWGTKGKPKGLSMREYMGMTPSGRAYYNKVCPPELRITLSA